MLARRVPVFKLIDKYVGESFVEEVEEGKRFYNVDELPRTTSHAGNNWLEFIGLFLALLGLLLAVFEPKLSKAK